MENDTQTQTAETAEEQTSQQTNTGESSTEETSSNEVKTLSAQKKHWREKAESLEKELTDFKTKEVKTESKTTESNEPNYGRLAYLASKGITHPDDIKVIEDYEKRSKEPLTEVIDMEHIKTRLKVNQDARTAQGGMPAGSQRAGGTTQHDVDYWVQKGTGLPDDQALAEKVVETRMGKDSSHRKFDPIRL